MTLRIEKIAAYPQAQLVTITKQELVKVDFALCNQPTETLEHYWTRQTEKPDLLINGGFFDMSSGQTVLTYKDNMRNISTYSDHLDGMGIIDGELVYGLLNKNFTDFISAHPTLVFNYKADEIKTALNLDYNARRTALGYNKQNVFVLLVDDPGLRFKEMQKILLNVGCQYAINLDGGGSTRCLEYGRLITDNIYSRPVDNVVALYLTEDGRNEIHRVQLGAFNMQENAKHMLKTIQALKDTINAGYRNAYIRYNPIVPYYRVQVGAFSVKANAQRVVDDLKKAGIEAFIKTE